MFKGKADLINEQGVHVATFDETCHHYGVIVAAVRLHAPLAAPFMLQGPELLAIFAKGIGRPVISVEPSDPPGTEICEFHGTSALGCVSDGAGVALVKSPGGNLSALLIVLAT